MKEKYLQFINKFTSINISKICKKLGINRSNILNGKSSEETTRLLYDELIKELKDIIEKEI